MLTILPPPCRIITSSTARVQTMGPLRFTRKMRSQSDSGDWTKGPTLSSPALLTMTCQHPPLAPRSLQVPPRDARVPRSQRERNPAPETAGRARHDRHLARHASGHGSEPHLLGDDLLHYLGAA